MTAFDTLGDPHSIAQQGEASMPTVTGLTGVSKGAGHYRTIELTFDDVAVALADEAGVVAYGGLKIVDMPEGAYAILGAVAALALTKSSAGVNADWDGDFSIGTVTASNNASLASTEQNIIPTTATPQAVSGATTAKGVSTAALYLDGTTTPSDIYLNFLVDDTDHNVTGTACNLIVNGTVTIHYLYLGNH
jgi:hypothetical protein